LEKEKDLAFIQLAKADVRDIKRLEQIKDLQTIAEENKPSIFQHPIAIVSYVLLAFLGGLAVGL
jgi:hypothetical protein